jgi:hypothetical protein
VDLARALFDVAAGISIAKKVWQGRERALLHQAMQGTAALHLRFGLLLAVALSPFLSHLG